MTDVETIAHRYIEAWNETSPERRRRLIEALWTADASFRDPVMQGDGPAGIDAVIEGVQNRFPGFRFNLIGKPDGFGDYVRLSWGLGPEGAEAPVKGTDFGLLEGDRLKSVTGFFDQLPAQ
jgi:hypothetical protein